MSRLSNAGLEPVDVTPRPRSSPAGRVVRFLRTPWFNAVGIAIMAIVLAAAVVGPSLVARSPTDQDLKARLQPPSSEHPFGTDQFGRDLLSRVVAGTRISLLVAAVVLLVAVAAGVLLGGLAGLWGGWVDEAIMRVADLFLAFPALVLAAAIATTLGPRLTNTMLALSTVYWPWYARLVRAQILGLREKEYVLAAESLGATRWWILIRHLLPNVFPIVLVQATIDVGYAILSTSTLSFLGLGAQPPTPEWGAMITAGRVFMQDSWWVATFPGLALAVTVLGFNLLGDGLRDWLDPRLRPV